MIAAGPATNFTWTSFFQDTCRAALNSPFVVCFENPVFYSTLAVESGVG